MPPEASRLADTRSWLQKSANDLRCAAIDLAADPPAPEDAVFHCQQAVEKALKAFLVWHDIPFPKTHDLGRLGSQVVQLDSTMDEPLDRVVDLSKYAWMFRYPGDPVPPTSQEAVEVLARAIALVNQIRARIPDTDSAR
jgi:HEPN domain-containing protein